MEYFCKPIFSSLLKPLNSLQVRRISQSSQHDVTIIIEINSILWIILKQIFDYINTWNSKQRTMLISVIRETQFQQIKVNALNLLKLY